MGRGGGGVELQCSTCAAEVYGSGADALNWDDRADPNLAEGAGSGVE